jgi:hypothetical protein
MTELLLKLLGKREVKRILNLWIKDQINVCLEQNARIQLDSTIWMEQYITTSKKFNECPEFLIDEPLEVDELFNFIGGRI